MCTAPGRIQFPDDEIVFQTTASLVERGSLTIAGIAHRTGEPPGRPPGTFGWAEGPEGRRYGLFGHGLSLVAAPMYALGRATAPPRVPFAWTRAVRSDHFTFHAREPRADWLHLVVSLTNCLVTAATAWLLVRWLAWVGLSPRAALWTGLAYATGTAAWPYTRTFLSEPLSAMVLLAAAVAIAQAQALRAGRPRAADCRLWLAGAAAGFAVHVHVLNLVAWPWLAAYALVPFWTGSKGHDGKGMSLGACLKALAPARRGLIGAALLAGLGLGLLLLGQWLRFGDALETGRFGHYSAWTNPWTGLWAQMLAPGRSLWLYAPAATLGLFGMRAALRRAPAATWLALSLLATRWLVVSARTDWYGGWSLGPRHLVPAIPLVMIGLAALIEDLPRRSVRVRRWVWSGLTASAALTGWLATRSIFEWMIALTNDPRSAGHVLETSHFAGWASPIVGFGSLQPDVLMLGAVRLARAGHPGLLIGFAVVAAIGLVMAGLVGRALWRARP
ncbi:hypothetical protein [Nannocystis bainbridge]|uniref:Glycosyltransferase RgtA/B/C/D-like domain-containing protein n=1 Tax=Nannocystis bainbridge TaxID=2995303 RepID=A0ABT5DPL9_9BACT|nr:hypothetical protein [Nannocystis bainbridge]MDC0715491.1 hypothetical protein [Nannocystis bainbridge]